MLDVWILTVPQLMHAPPVIEIDFNSFFPVHRLKSTSALEQNYSRPLSDKFYFCSNRKKIPVGPYGHSNSYYSTPTYLHT